MKKEIKVNNLKIIRMLDKCKFKGNLSEKPLRVISGFLALIIMCTSLTGCGKLFNTNNDYNNYDNYDNNSGYYDSNYDEDYDSDYDYNFDDSSDNYTDSQELKKLLNIYIQINSNDLNSFQNFISQIKVNYKYSEHFNIQEGLNKYNKLNNSSNIKSSNVIKNNKVDYDSLYSIIKKNNSNYLNKNNDNDFYKNLSDSTLSKTIQYIVDTVNYNIKNNSKIDLNVLDYKLSNLKIYEYNDFGYAFYSHDDVVLALNLSIIPNTSNDKMTAFQEVVMHETNHLLQDSIISRDSNIEQNYGFCYQFKDMELNSLYWIWFVEAAAQSGALKQNNVNPNNALVYDSGVLALDSLNASSAFVKDTNLDLGSLMVKNDLNELFKYFGCTTNEDKEEILKMMISNNLILETYDFIYSDAFYSKFSNIDTYTYKKELKGSIGQTLTKVFYRNLSEKIKNKSVKLEDVFSLISIFETDLSRNIGYASLENCDYLDEFYANYALIQNEFFEIISNSLNVSLDEIYSYYFSYHNLTDQSNLNNNLLNEEQKKFYTNLYNVSEISKDKAVSEVYNKLNSKTK